MTTLPSCTPTEMFVDGKWTGGSAGSFAVLDPSTGAEIASVPARGRGRRARRGVGRGAARCRTGPAPRRANASEVLRRTFELMIERKEELAFLMSLEMGKSLTDARGEVVYAAEFFRWFAEEAVRVGGELRTAPSGANRILTFRKPVGVALLLTPWNFPAAMATRKIAPGAGGGLHGRAQAGRGHPADRADARLAAGRGRRAGRRGERADDRQAG